MAKCEKGFTDGNGSCCCNCIHQKQINKHPVNKGESKGSIMDLFGYACTYQHADESNEGIFMFFEGKHGMCECYQSKENK